MRSSPGSGWGIGISDKAVVLRKRVIKAFMVEPGERCSSKALPS